MPTIHPATSYEIGKRVGAKLKNGTELKAKVLKIIGDKNLLKIVPEEGEPREGEEINVNAERCRKLRGPAPGSTRTPKAKEVEEDVEDGSDDADEASEAQTSGKFGTLSLEDMESMLDAHTQMIELLQVAIVEAKKPKAKPAAPEKKSLMGKGKRRPMAEDEGE